MDIELIDDNLPGSPLSFSTTLDDDPVAPAISGVTVTAGGSRYAKVGDEVTVSFDIGSETQSGVAVPPALSFFGGAAYAELVDYATAPSSGLIGSYTARYVLVDANLPATSAAGEPVVDFSLSVADRVGNVREYVAGDEAALDNVKYYKGDPVLTVSDITTTNANPAWSNASDTITLVFALDDDRDPAVGYPAVRIAGSDTSPETVDVTRNGAEYTATYQLSAADPEAEIAYEITFQGRRRAIGDGSGDAVGDHAGPDGAGGANRRDGTGFDQRSDCRSGRIHDQLDRHGCGRISVRLQ
jgi:hypothetical protein